jgi:hypothetical protein
MQPKQKFTTEQFLELYNKGLKDQQIADKLNVSRMGITRKRWRLELPPQNPRSNTNPKLSHRKLKEIMKKQNQKPQRKEEKRIYLKDYNNRPEIKAKHREYHQRPEVKAKQREYSQRPEIKAKRREYANRPEIKAKQREYSQRPEVRAKRKTVQRKANQKYRQTPKGKITIKKLNQKYYQKRKKENPN